MSRSWTCWTDDWEGFVLMFVAACVLIGVFALLIALLALLRLFGRKVVGNTPAPRAARVLDWQPSAGVVRLRSDRFTRARGEYGVWWDGRRGHARVGEVLSINSRLKTVDRELLSVRGDPPRKGIEWTGQVFSGVAKLGLPWTEVEINTALGPAPAWYVPAAGSAWAIHIHGIRVNRLSPLRGVPAFSTLGFHSLVISHRGDGDGPAVPGRSSRLGLDEWPDVEAAIDHAIAHGAERVILVGWSMGGGMALLAGERARNRDAIDGMVLVAPTTDWRRIILHGARVAHVPAWIGRTVIAGLGASGWATILGASAPINFDALDWTADPGRVRIPSLIIHSPDDDEVPFHLSELIADRNPLVRLAVVPKAFHTLEWNSDRHAFDAAIVAWLGPSARNLD